MHSLRTLLPAVSHSQIAPLQHLIRLRYIHNEIIVILYITRLIILIFSSEITLKNDFGIKGLIHYTENNGNIFWKKHLSATFILKVQLYV